MKNITSTFGVAHFEISVALNHDVDDLLIGIVAEIKESYKTESEADENNKPVTVSLNLKNIELPRFLGSLRIITFTRRRARI